MGIGTDIAGLPWEWKQMSRDSHGMEKITEMNMHLTVMML